MKIGFIGCGNMGTAMMHGILAAGKCVPEDMMASAAHADSLKQKKETLGIRTSENNSEVAAFADILFLAVKPQYYAEVIDEIKHTVTEEKVVVALAPGKTLEWLSELFGVRTKVVRIMPNTPALCANICKALYTALFSGSMERASNAVS